MADVQVLAEARRQRRLRKIRGKIAEKKKVRISVHRTNQHIYAQVFSQDGATTLASVSTISKDFLEAKQQQAPSGKIEEAKVVGKILAEKIKQLNLPEGLLAFDRSGYKYHGRVKALLESARENGVQV